MMLPSVLTRKRKMKKMSRTARVTAYSKVSATFDALYFRLVEDAILVL
jgi:hypothetical protein